jgi:hypothetical protein
MGSKTKSLWTKKQNKEAGKFVVDAYKTFNEGGVIINYEMG